MCFSGLLKRLRRQDRSERPPSLPSDPGDTRKRSQRSGSWRILCWRKKAGTGAAADSDDGPAFWKIEAIKEESRKDGAKRCYDLDIHMMEWVPEGTKIFKNVDANPECSFSSGIDPIACMKEQARIEKLDEPQRLIRDKPEFMEEFRMKPNLVAARLVSTEAFVINEDKFKTQGKETEDSLVIIRKHDFDDMLAPQLDSQAMTKAWLDTNPNNPYEEENEIEICDKDKDDNQILDEESKSSNGNLGGISTSAALLTTQDQCSLVPIRMGLNVPVENYRRDFRARLSRMLESNAFHNTNNYMKSEKTLSGFGSVVMGSRLGGRPDLSNLDSPGPACFLIGMNYNKGIIRWFNAKKWNVNFRFDWRECLPKVEFLDDPDLEV